ncbi:terminase small subunit [Clostridium perfringens]|mgnify:CR=1 FL=1|uniref:terminase small subunit n=1 Tax=Clostridium perfringens TaxID=1502 RepID=UPI000DA29C3E|nr:terminase small subunit [Clostridium perfringens]EGT5618324.1 phage portal protein [Clostridium perfringens]MBI6014498.1 terminase small subunit [Clostridium perfringens]MDH2339174.1 terminase small subunit [Clostridium perfringens]MDH5080566.1 Terminase small subunit [Clostridium perfringens]MDK0874155.1 terminase small subunit [Clostridium perfringens]
MARARSPNRDKAFEIYKDHDGDIKLIDIAKELNIKDSQIRKWKSQDNWDEKLKGALPISKGNVTNQNKNKTNIKKEVKEPIAEEVKEVLENAELTDKQRLFCIYYIKYFNATKAYKKAYGCSYETAMVEGFRTLRNPKIQSEIEKLKQHKLNQVMLSEEDIFQMYMDIAFSDITDYVNFGKREIEILEDNQSKTIEVNYVDFNDSYNVDGTIISEVKQGKDGVSIKLHDKMKALQWLSDHMNIATDKQKAELEVLKSRIVKDNSKNNTNSTAKLDSILGQIKERNKNE